ncbi:Zinc finger and BTB domain-containing protein 40 [Folsomia candida]|uniref:Zinc finger and BTB domain-containing protein 40 n=1 Tax=Folsomia candida TaxID=158441 RepID=A0A226DAD6_FOLCA|nr:Zinc finger and BTB domain-containing protein 40 [Folsomia candida]
MNTSHLNSGQFVCNMCNNKFDTHYSLVSHLNRKSCVSSQKENSKKGQNIKCTYCSMSFEKQQALILHVKREHYDSEYKTQCTKCEKKFKNIAGLRNHTNTVHKNKRNFRCLLCKSAFNKNLDLQKHMQSMHSEKSTKKAEEKKEQVSPAEISLDNYRKFKANPGDETIPCTIINSEYYLKLVKQQFQNLEPERLETPVILDEVNGQRHKQGWGYKSEEKNTQVAYVQLTEEELLNSKKIFGYIWRDPVTFEVVAVYFGLNEEDCKVAAEKEAFEVKGLVATSKWVAGQLKWFTRNETGSICSVKPKECYGWLANYLEQLRAALRSTNDLWLGPVLTVQLSEKEELNLARRELEIERGKRCEMEIGFTEKLSFLTTENYNLTAVISNLTKENSNNEVKNCKLLN